MAIKKTSKNMIRGSWFGKATVSVPSLINGKVIGLLTATEYLSACNDIAGLYEYGNDLYHLIRGECPRNGLDAKTEVPRLRRFCNAVQAVKDEARKNGLPLQLGYNYTDTVLKPVWYVDVDSPETEVFEIKITPYGRKILKTIGHDGIAFDTDVIECH